MMDSKKAFSLIGANIALLNAFTAYCQQKENPNVVFVLIDDMGWRDLGCYGSEFYETPNIDALCSESVRFTQAYASCHVSSPARASLLTGMYPASIGLTDWLPGRREYPFQQLSTVHVEQDLPKDLPNIASTMKSNGYSTAIIGKWHLGENGAKPQEYGFDLHVPDGYLRGWPDTYYAPFGMNGYDGEPGDYLTDRMTEEALSYIRDHSDKPFFLLLSHFATHDPIEGRADLVAKYRAKLAALPPSERPGYILEGNPDDPCALSEGELLELLNDPTYAAHRILPHNLVKVKQLQDNVNFAAMVESVDQSVGRVVHTLDSLGISDNTILVFFADNGGMSAANYGNPNKVIQPRDVDRHYASSMLPLRGGKGWMYEGGLRVPLIIRWPSHGINGAVCDTPVTTPDLYRTLVSMTGVRCPDGAGSDGVDISPLLEGKGIAERSIFWHFPHYSNHGMASPCGAVRKGDFKLIEYYQRGTVQLFNVREDIGEKHDLSAEYPQIVSQLKAELAQWRKSVGALMPEKNLSYDGNLARIWYNDAVPVKFWPFRVDDCQYGAQGSERELVSAFVPSGPVQKELLGTLKDLEEYRLKNTPGAWENLTASFKQYRQRKREFGEDEATKMLWNIFCTQLFDLSGNGSFLLAAFPRVEGEYAALWSTVRHNHVAGELNNNIEVTAMCDGQTLPGVKFGGGVIEVSRDKGTTTVCLKQYTVPNLYRTYSIDVLVGTGNPDFSVELNGQPVRAKINNRGFVSVRRMWKEGDVLKVTRE